MRTFVKDIAGQRFGLLVALRRVGYRSPTRKEVVWECVCDCGKTHTAVGCKLRAGKVTSCGCNRSARGHAGRAHYNWKGGYENVGSLAWAAARRASINAKARSEEYKGLDATPEEIVSAFEKCGGVCQICSGANQKGTPHLDHCHKTGALRGFLCNHCNSLLGHAFDLPDILRAAANYLEAPSDA